MEGINFDELCIRGINNDEDLDMQELMEAVIAMDKWYLLIERVLDDGKIIPIVGDVNEKLWTFGFTDARRARKFAREKKITADTVVIDPAVCVPWLKEHERFGIVGIRFNEGKLGWYVSTKNLEYIMKMKVK